MGEIVCGTSDCKHQGFIFRGTIACRLGVGSRPSAPSLEPEALLEIRRSAEPGRGSWRRAASTPLRPGLELAMRPSGRRFHCTRATSHQTNPVTVFGSILNQRSFSQTLDFNKRAGWSTT